MTELVNQRLFSDNPPPDDNGKGPDDAQDKAEQNDLNRADSPFGDPVEQKSALESQALPDEDSLGLKEN